MRDKFLFTAEKEFPYSGIARGPWIKISARKYKHADSGMTCLVGSINAKVMLVERDTVAAEYAAACRNNDPFRRIGKGRETMMQRSMIMHGRFVIDPDDCEYCNSPEYADSEIRPQGHGLCTEHKKHQNEECAADAKRELSEETEPFAR